MFRRAHASLAAFIFSAVALTACERGQITEAKPIEIAKGPAITDSLLKTLRGTLHVMYQPAVDGDTSATSLMFAFWELEIAPDERIRLAGDVLGNVPALDGADVYVTGRFSYEQLVVESYALVTPGAVTDRR